MRKLALGHRAGSAIVAAGLLTAGVLLTINGTMPAAAQAGAGDIPAIEVPVRNVRRHTMPRGGVVTAADVERERAALAWYERRRPRPKYSAELARLKNLPAPRNVPTRYAPEAPADTRSSHRPPPPIRCDGDTAPTAKSGTVLALRGLGVDDIVTVDEVKITRRTRSCADRSDETLRSLLGLSAEEQVFDPNITYDRARGEFVIAAVHVDFSGPEPVESLAVANSTDASGQD